MWNASRNRLAASSTCPDGKAIVADNADWLLGLNSIKFLREVGVHFSVNRMLGAECYKNRLASENGLSFFEMNYMIMQAYDFYVLHKKYNCVMELGGDDQWSNMIAGVELIRRKDRQPAFCMTNTLLTNSQGQKMGKTVGGGRLAVSRKTSPFDFYQYWRNVDDADVEKCLALLTFLPMDEVRRLGALEGSKINKAKVTLAYEVTKNWFTEKKKPIRPKQPRKPFWCWRGYGKCPCGGSYEGAIRKPAFGPSF